MFDLLSIWLPPGNSWLHEEWHRAVSSRHHIRSYNEVYDFKLFNEAIKISHVTDHQLAELKLHSPPDFIRLSAAGIEAQNVFNFTLEKAMFFRGKHNFDDLLLWLNVVNNIAYLGTFASDPISYSHRINNIDSIFQAFYFRHFFSIH